jgi:hypothetical protein
MISLNSSTVEQLKEELARLQSEQELAQLQIRLIKERIGEQISKKRVGDTLFMGFWVEIKWLSWDGEVVYFCKPVYRKNGSEEEHSLIRLTATQLRQLDKPNIRRNLWRT